SRVRGARSEDVPALELVGRLLGRRGEARGDEEHRARPGLPRRGRVGPGDFDAELERSGELLARIRRVLPDDRGLGHGAIQPRVLGPRLRRVRAAAAQPGKLRNDVGRRETVAGAWWLRLAQPP